MARFRYNTQCQPPAPFVHITLMNPGNAAVAIENVPALLDTGADCTIVPADVIGELHLKTSGYRWIQGVGSQPFREPTFAVRLNVRATAQQQLLNIVTSESEPFVLLGRDFMNAYRILLDAPNGLVEIT